MKGLVKLLRTAGVVKHGKFRLVGGGTADFYIDLKRAYGDPSALAALSHQLALMIPPQSTVIASGGYGGIPLATAVSLRLGLPLTLIRPEPKTHGTARMIDGYVPGKSDRVALIDDVYTTGGSLARMERALRSTKAVVIGRFVVVTRAAKLPRGVRALVDATLLI